MNMQDVATVFPVFMELIGTIIILVATRYIIPWMKEQRIYSSIRKWVRAAEKLAEAGELSKGEKKQYVETLLRKRGITITDEIDAMIEAAVKELDIAADTVISEIISGVEIEE